MWCALIEGIAAHAKQMAGEKLVACCVRGYHEYKGIEAAATREVPVCHCWRAIVRKIFVVKIIFV